MSNRKELVRQLRALESELAELRRMSDAKRRTDAVSSVRSVFGLMKAFYDAPGHRLPAAEAIRAGMGAGFTSEQLEDFRGGTNPALQREADGYVLTASGQRWYEDCFAVLMSRTE